MGLDSCSVLFVSWQVQRRALLQRDVREPGAVLPDPGAAWRPADQAAPLRGHDALVRHVRLRHDIRLLHAGTDEYKHGFVAH